MIVTDYTRKALAYRRQKKLLEALGYRRCEVEWELIRGFRSREVIQDVQIDAWGSHVWIKTGLPHNGS